jgi:hypothetical protein
MKKIYLLLLIFIVFSCKNTPKGKNTDDPGLSQLDLTKEKTQAAQSPGFSDEPPLSMTQDTSADSSADDSFLDESAIVQDGITDGFATDDLADAQNNEQTKTAEAVEEKKDTTEEKKASANEVKPPASIAAVQPPPAPPARPVQPPPAAAKEEPPAAKTQGEEAPAAEKPADEKQEDQSESEEPPPPPARYQPWITPPPVVSAVKDDAPVPNKQTLIPPKEENVFSRIVRASVGQLVEIPFRGNNWSYLEDMVSRRGIAYMSRRVDSEGMTFTFRAEETGIFALRFYRRDYIRDYILYDYVQVIVEEQPNKGSAGAVNSPIDRGKVTAEPRWPSALEEAEMLRGGARTSSGNNDGSSASSNVSSANRGSTAAPAQGTAAPPQTASSNRETQTQGTGAAPQTVTPSATPSVTPSVTPPAVTQQPVMPTEMQADAAPPAEKKEKLPPEEILKKAQDAFNGGKAAEAIALLDQYTEFYPGGNDELYWMYGQFYEANTPSRNILLSLDYYRRLVNEYPQSTHYNDARRRISYLERFYINIQ